jgi:hypothetical protein
MLAHGSGAETDGSVSTVLARGDSEATDAERA